MTTARAATAPPPAARDVVVRSFDGTPIVVHFFPAAGLRARQRAATVLEGPGWSSGGDTDSDSRTSDLTGSIGLGPLRHHGYNAVTWDPRGFGASGGEAEVDSPFWEGRDVSAILDWLARQPEARLDAPGDPRVGMAGGSYGGGVQFAAAIVDRRIDAIVPSIAWHSLETSLDKDDAVKFGWGSALCALGLGSGTAGGLHGPAGPQTGSVDAHVTDACVEGLATGLFPVHDLDWFRARGPAQYLRHVRIPTLLVQGTADTLFTLREAIDNFRSLSRNRVPLKMVWFCGGHGVCATNGGRAGHIDAVTLNWFDRYLRGQRVSTGARFEYVDDTGTWRAAPTYPARRTGALRARGSGVLAISPAGSAQSGALVAATPAVNALDVVLPTPAKGAEVVGEPVLELRYGGLAAPMLTHVYAQIVDLSTGRVLGNQATPLPLVLDGHAHTLRRPLEALAVHVTPASRLVLQLTDDSTTYTQQRSAGALTVSQVDITVPLVDPGRVIAASAA